MTEITATSTKLVYRNSWIEVHEDEIEYADGTPGLYGVIHRPDFSLIIPMTETGFYLVEQYRYPTKARHWEFPQTQPNSPAANSPKRPASVPALSGNSDPSTKQQDSQHSEDTSTLQQTSAMARQTSHRKSVA